MITIHAPYANTTTVSYLPDPEFDNTRALTSSVASKRALDGTRYTYVKSKPHKKLQFTFRMTTEKNEEFKALLDAYAGQEIRLIDHHGQAWRVRVTSDELKYETQTRDNWVQSDLECQGVLVNG